MNFDIAMTDINARVDAAYTLLGDFFDEYFATSDSNQLIFDAQHRQDVLCARVFSVLDLLSHAKRDIDALEPTKGGEEE